MLGQEKSQPLVMVTGESGSGGDGGGGGVGGVGGVVGHQEPEIVQLWGLYPGLRSWKPVWHTCWVACERLGGSQ